MSKFWDLNAGLVKIYSRGLQYKTKVVLGLKNYSSIPWESYPHYDTFVQCWSFSGTFIIYALINAASIIFVIMVVTETKGRTLEQIQAAINA